MAFIQTLSVTLAIFAGLNGTIFGVLKQSSIPTFIGFSLATVFISLPLMA